MNVEGKKVVPPPRPKSSRPPPPKPKSSVSPKNSEQSIVDGHRNDSKTKASEGNTSLLSNLLEAYADPSSKTDPFTGFGEWVEVFESGAKKSDSPKSELDEEGVHSEHVLTLEDRIKESKDSAIVGGKLNTMDLRIDEKSKRQIKVHTSTESGEHQFRRVITKKPRRTVDSDD